MASGSLSPRQKMINMMYLVLTALLALNVSAEILQSFQTIADSLRKSSNEFGKENAQLAADIKKTIEDNAGENKSSKDLKYIPALDIIKKETAKVINGIEEFRDDLFEDNVGGLADGSSTSNKRLKRLDERDKNLTYWLGDNEEANDGHGEGKATDLRNLLEDYIAWATKFEKEWLPKNQKAQGFPPIVQEPKEFLPENDPNVGDLRSKTWEYYTFHGMPAVANLAILEKFKMDIRVIESDLLQMIRSQLNKLTFKLDQITAIEAPESKVVVAGMTYKTRLFVGAFSKEARPQFSGSGSIKNEQDGTATMSLPARASVVPRGKVSGTQTYTASIRVAKADGGDTTMTIKGKFTVVKPSVTVRSVAVNKVYRNCLNKTEIDVPLLSNENLYNPKLTAQGGEVKTGKKNKQEVILIPTTGGNKMIVNVKSLTNGQLIEIDNLEFGVTDPPRPNVDLRPKDNTADANGTVGIKLYPDKDFVQLYPQDARYVIGSIRVLRRRGLGLAQPVGNIPASAVATSPTTSATLNSYGAKRGDTYAFEVEGIYRVNYQGARYKERFTKAELTQLVNVK